MTNDNKKPNKKMGRLEPPTKPPKCIKQEKKKDSNMNKASKEVDLLRFLQFLDIL